MPSDGSFSIGSTVWPGVSKLIEEMGELHQVLGKIIATHGNPAHWDGSDLIQRFEEEAGDVIAAVNFVVDHNRLDRMTVGYRAQEKLELFCKWHAEQGQ